MSQVLAKVDRTLTAIENSVLFLGMAVAFGATMLNVIMRYVFSDPLTWPPEMARYCHILVVFFGASAALKAGIHLRVDVIYEFLPASKKFCHYFRDVIFILFGVAVIYMSIGLLEMQYVTGQTSIALRIPFYILYAIPAMGSLLMVIRSLMSLIRGMEPEGA